MKQNYITIILLAVLVYIVSSGISYAVFSLGNVPLGKITQSTSKIATLAPRMEDGRIVFDADLPKTESCPLNGAKYSAAQKEWWGKHRPLGVMIENHQESKPQSGLSFADVLYEAVAEGGITRFLAVYYCQDAGIIGPVRSARAYFLDFISEYGEYPLYAHVGGANTPGPADALGQIIKYGWSGYNDLNEFSIGCPVFCRNEDRQGRHVATEHTMYSSTNKLWDFAKEDRKLSNVDKDKTAWDKGFVEYSFKDDGPKSGTPQTVHLEFWDRYDDYFVDWAYDPVTNSYKRTNGGATHKDKNTGKQLSAKNLVVIVMDESNANDGYDNNVHLLYDTIGSGKAAIFMDGKQIKGKWKKEDRSARTIIQDETGKPVKFNRGTIWFSVLPTDGILSVK